MVENYNPEKETCAELHAMHQVSYRAFFAIIALVSVFLFILTVGRFYPSGDLTLFMSSADSLNIFSERQPAKNWKSFRIHGRGRRQPGCSDADIDNTTASGARISLRNLKPWQFLPQYKSPCYLDRDENGGKLFRCLPYFYLAGFPKCGTTDLHFRLVQHPYIMRGAQKEPHFLTRFMYKTACSMRYKYLQASTKCYLQKYMDTYYGRAIDKIKRNNPKNKQFIKPLKSTWESQENPAPATKTNQIITVDGSASTAWDNRNWRYILENRGCSEPVVGPADIVTSMNPKVKVVMILRDPTERLYSDYVYFKRGEPPTREDFHERAISCVRAFRNCTSQKPLSLCLLERMDMRLHLGLYHVFISDWLRVLPPSRLLVLHSESYRANVTASLEKAFRFLQLPLLTRSAMTKIANLKEKNRNKKKKSIGPMFPETEALLRGFYSEHNERLAEVLNDERFAWRR